MILKVLPFIPNISIILTVCSSLSSSLRHPSSSRSSFKTTLHMPIGPHHAQMYFWCPGHVAWFQGHPQKISSVSIFTNKLGCILLHDLLNVWDKMIDTFLVNHSTPSQHHKCLHHDVNSTAIVIIKWFFLVISFLLTVTDSTSPFCCSGEDCLTFLVPSDLQNDILIQCLPFFHCAWQLWNNIGNISIWQDALFQQVSHTIKVGNTVDKTLP